VHCRRQGDVIYRSVRARPIHPLQDLELKPREEGLDAQGEEELLGLFRILATPYLVVLNLVAPAKVAVEQLL